MLILSSSSASFRTLVAGFVQPVYIMQKPCKNTELGAHFLFLNPRQWQSLESQSNFCLLFKNSKMNLCLRSALPDYKVRFAIEFRGNSLRHGLHRGSRVTLSRRLMRRSGSIWTRGGGEVWECATRMTLMMSTIFINRGKSMRRSWTVMTRIGFRRWIRVMMIRGRRVPWDLGMAFSGSRNKADVLYE